ncbi:hypothetical protein BGY98DRAFT_1185979 [Russula aff. rugulosa BPL654]|nr:hypothetical protein BGY98DRAFT_1185979 [Russula aff. rugulosa BPL654]
MRTCPSSSYYRHLSPLRRRPVSYSLVHSCSALAATAFPVHLNSHATAIPTHTLKASSSLSSSSSTLPISASSFASLAAQHPNRLENSRTLTALHTARELIARIFPSQSPESSFWNKVLCEASDEISRSNISSKEDRITIVVYAVDEFSGGEALVSALLQDPFSPEIESVRISKRWEGREQDSRLDIEYAASQSNPESPASSSSRVIRLPSSFLASMPLPVRLIELRPTRELSQDNLRLLYTAHIPVILLNPLTTPLTTLSSYSSLNPKAAILPYPLPPHALLLITSPSPISTSSSIPPTGFELGVSPNRVFFVDPNRALSSSLALRTNAQDVLHVQRYSDDALASGLSMLKRELQSVPTSVQKGDALVSAAVGVLRNSLDGVEAELREAAALVRTIRNETSHESADARRAVFGSVAPERYTNKSRNYSDDDKSKSKQQQGRAAMTRADDVVLPVLDNMTWWRVLWAPDEVGWRMRQAVRDAWVGSIASSLLPALATLPSTQSSQSSRALSRTSALPQTLRSPVLLNALNQLTHTPSFTLEPRALLRPLEHRLLERLDVGPTTALARAAQVLILRVAGSVGVGAVSGVLMFMQQVGEGLGAGMLLGAAAGFRWAIGRWDKIRKMWRADWVRVKEAAERDVEATLNQALEKQVLIVPTQAADGIEDIVAKRKDEIGQLRLDVDKLPAATLNLKSIAHRVPTIPSWIVSHRRALECLDYNLFTQKMIIY